MNSSLMDRNLNEDSYEEYVEKIINIFRLSNKKSSILFQLEIKDYKATIQLTIVNQNGEKEEFSDVVLKCDEVFYHSFLIPLIEKVNHNVTITHKDIVNLDEDDLVTFRMITDNNDLFTIDGLSRDDANSLLEISNNDSYQEKILTVPNKDGIGNIWSFLLMIGVLVIAFILIVIFIG